MNVLRECRQQSEIQELLRLGHWPRSAPETLRAHAAHCRRCADAVLLAQAFGDARAASVAAASPPPASVLWWRAQLRRRNAAVARLQRPLVGAQIFAMAIAFALLLGTLVLGAAQERRWVGGMVSWMASLSHATAFHFGSIWPFAAGQTDACLAYLVPGAAMLLLLGGAALYLATEKQ